MGIVSYFKQQYDRMRSKHQVHVRRNKSTGFRRRGRTAVARINPAGTKLAKYFAKAKFRGPRGY
jgi:hypothetical protein